MPLRAFGTGSPAGMCWAEANDVDQHSLETPLHGHFWELQLWQYTTLLVKGGILNISPASANFTGLIVHHDLVMSLLNELKNV